MPGACALVGMDAVVAAEDFIDLEDTLENAMKMFGRTDRAELAVLKNGIRHPPKNKH